MKKTGFFNLIYIINKKNKNQMKHIRTFEKYRVVKNREEIIKESVLQVNDIYKVKTMVDIPQSLVNSYIKKVKDNAGKNLRQFFGDVDIAEEIVKFINTNFVDVDQIPADLLMGGGQPSTEQGEETQNAEVEVEPQSDEPAPSQEAPVEPVSTESEEELELPSGDEGFEEPIEEPEQTPESEEETESEETESEEESEESEEESDETESDDDDLLI